MGWKSGALYQEKKLKTMTRKINWILILQAWAMLWVVVGHAPLLSVDMIQPGYVEILYRIAYSFHMPLFIFV